MIIVKGRDRFLTHGIYVGLDSLKIVKRIDDRVKLSKDTQRILKITFKKDSG